MRAWLRFAVALAVVAMTLAAAQHVGAACPADQDITDLKTAATGLAATPPALDDATNALNDIRDSGGAVAVRPILDDLLATPPKLDDAQARIASLRTFLQQPTNGACTADSQASKSALNDVYASPVFANLGKPPDENAFTRFANWVASLFSHLGTRGTTLFLVLLLGGLLGLALWRLRGLAAGRRVELGETAELPRSNDQAAEWAAAESAAEAGDFREAVRRAFRSALLAVAERGRLYVDPSWTNRELLARAATDADLLAQLAPAAASFERAWYSRITTGAADWEVARNRCAAIRELARGRVAVS